MKAILCWVLCFQFLLLLSSCKKDKVPTPIISPTNDHCPQMYNLRSEEYPFEIYKTNALPGCATMFEIIQNDLYNYNSFVVNPHNEFEIIFTRQLNNSTSPPRFELCKYNFCSNSLNILRNDLVSGVDWSVTNWLLFRTEEGLHVRIKPNGDSLTVLGSHSQGIYAPNGIWNPGGNKFLIKKSNNEMLVLDFYGNQLHSIPQNMTVYNWTADNKIIYANSSSVYTYDLATDEKTPLFQLAWVNSIKRDAYQNGKYYISTDYGFYEFNNNQLQLIDSSYNTYYGTGFSSLDSDNNILVRTCFDTTSYDQCKIFVNQSISIFNKTTQSERRIIFPN